MVKRQQFTAEFKREAERPSRVVDHARGRRCQGCVYHQGRFASAFPAVGDPAGSGTNELKTIGLVQRVLLSLVGATALLGCTQATPSQTNDSLVAELPQCTERQMAAIAPAAEEIAAHRRFGIPVLTVAPPHDPERSWGLDLLLLVDETGAVSCYEVEDSFGRPQPMTGERAALLHEMTGWRFKPFLRDGTAVPAVVREQIYEQRVPQQRRPAP